MTTTNKTAGGIEMAAGFSLVANEAGLRQVRATLASLDTLAAAVVDADHAGLAGQRATLAGYEAELLRRMGR